MVDIVVPCFSTSRLSLRWLKSNFHPNMIPHCKRNVIKILEIGLLFKEDALFVEDALQIEDALKHRKPGDKGRIIFFQLSTREKILSAVAVGISIVAIPLRSSISTRGNAVRAICWAATGAAVPVVQRYMIPNTLAKLLKTLSSYTILLRKCLAYVRNQSYQNKNPRTVPTYAINTLLIQQQKELCSYFRNFNVALESLFVWMPPSSEISVENAKDHNDEIIKFHYLYLILQSTFLKYVAIAHLTPSSYAIHMEQNRNEKIYWIHSEVFPALNNLVGEYFASLDNAYRYFKDNSYKDMLPKGLPKITRDPWIYSEVHANVVLCSSEIKSALMKCNEIDNFLEACWKAKSKFSPQVFDEDLSKLKKEIIKSFNTVETISVQLKKIQMAEIKILEQAVQKLQLPAVEEEDTDTLNIKSISEDTEIEVKDQVFYFIKTDNDRDENQVKDLSTAPGTEEINTTKIVLDELKVKLVEREDIMREREAIALENTMPEYKGKVPDFPRQSQILNKPNLCTNSEEIEEVKCHNNLILKNVDSDNKIVNNKLYLNDENNIHVEANCDKSSSKTLNIADEKKIDKYEANVSDCTTDDDAEINGEGSNPEFNDFEKSELLRDIRKYRISRKKNHPPKNENIEYKNSNDTNDDRSIDEDLQPVEYRFGTNMAMATLLHIQNSGKGKFLEENEEVFIGDGEVSSDSGNEL